MTPVTRVIFAAGYGESPRSGLYRFANNGRGWAGNQVAHVDNLCALAWHPKRPVIYGVSSDGEGRVHAWDVSGRTAQTLTELPTGGYEPCHVSVAPGGNLLVVTNYSSSNFTVWPVAADGSLGSASQVIALAGRGSDGERQDASHPHQAIFEDGDLHVVDLGTDTIRSYSLVGDPEHRSISSTAISSLPPGTGPRHMVMIDGGAVAITGELASTMLVGYLGQSLADWTVQPSTNVKRRDSDLRNYPGDIQSSSHGRFVHLANRGNDTIATWEIKGRRAQFIAESVAGVQWPQHLAVVDNRLVVAGRNSSTVVALSLVEGVPGEPEPLFDCPGAAWLLPEPR